MGTPAKYPIKIHVCEPDITDKEIAAVTEAVKNNWLSSIAPPVRHFEEAFAKKFGTKHAISVNSGGSALFLALKALDIGPGHEVIVPDSTMIATASAVDHCGATPIFIDAAPGSFNIDISKIEDAITPLTRAIIPVHIYGHPVDMDPLLALARKYNLLVVEDAAEAHGAKYKERYVGTIGKAGCFSFYANKIMTSGEGGMIVTDDDHLADRLARWRGYNFDDERHFWHKTHAWNLRMPALSAALGLAQLERLDELILKRLANATYYAGHLKHIPEITLFGDPPNTEPVSWMFPLLAERRDELMEFLAERGVETRTFFIPMHVQPIYKRSGDYPQSDHLGANGLYLPSSSHLTRKEQDYVIQRIKEFYGAKENRPKAKRSVLKMTPRQKVSAQGQKRK